MGKTQCEIFGVVAYNPELGYHELYELEERLAAGLQGVLEAFGADHVDFWGMGDALQFRCGLAAYELPTLREICDAVAPLLTEDATARFVAIDRRLYDVRVFFIAPNGWREERVDMTDRYYLG
ncbi:MAG: hypothetical protein AB7E47_13810 [Desulfovibrionaceae bacterium]